ncbi:hypothetical protein BDV93DRAFT_512555 [Ceratobasidium sp. AG-I]|nr:hypothetical protein BDV93DRAFT_512555 [Ceratobasidium sp. AG-I]
MTHTTRPRSDRLTTIRTPRGEKGIISRIQAPPIQGERAVCTGRHGENAEICVKDLCVWVEGAHTPHDLHGHTLQKQGATLTSIDDGGVLGVTPSSGSSPTSGSSSEELSESSDWVSEVSNLSFAMLESYTELTRVLFKTHRVACSALSMLASRSFLLALAGIMVE